MERLTMRDVGGMAFWISLQSPGGGYRLSGDKEDQRRLDRLAAYEDTGLEPEEIDSVFIHGVIKENRRFKELAQAEKDGRVVVLPCKVGDMVYEVNKRGFISTYQIISIHVSSCSVLVGWNLVDGIYSNLNGFEVSALGKIVFLTREEAEAALKKREEETYDT